MEVVLTKEDIKELIKSKYSGVTDIKFNTKNLKVSLTVEPKMFFNSPIVKTEIPLESTTESPKANLTDEEQLKVAAKERTMAAGGNVRTMATL